MPTYDPDYSFVADAPAIGEQVTANFDKLRTLLNNTKLDESNLQDAAVITRCIADGAVTLDKLADGAISTDAVVDSAITPRKLDSSVTDEAGGSSDLTLSTSYQDVPGATLTFNFPTASFVLIWGAAEFILNGSDAGTDNLISGAAQAALFVDASEQQRRAAVGGTMFFKEGTFNVFGDPYIRAGAALKPLRATLASGSHTIKLRAKLTDDAGIDSATCQAEGTGLCYMAVSQ